MTYRLLGSLTSPYVRRLRMYMADIPYELEIVNYLETDQDSRLSSVNPIKRIPVLLIDGKPLWESRMIVQYLQRTHGLRSLSLDEENTVSAIDALQDLLIQSFLLYRSGHPIDRQNGYFLRTADRQRLILSYLEQQVSAGLLARWDYPAMSLYALLDWASFRSQLPLAQLGPALQQFVKESASQRLAAETDPRLA